MKTFAFYSAMEQSPKKFKQAAHCLAFLCRKTPVSYAKMKHWSLRQCIKQAKKHGWNPDIDWRDYPNYKPEK